MSNSEHPMIPTPQPQLMSEARQSLTGNWGLAVATYLVFIAVVGASSFIPFGGLIVGGPLALGFAMFSLNLARNKKGEISQLFDGFQHFVNALVAQLLMTLLITVGMIFLIVPGIIIALGLSMTMFILADNPQMTGVDALKKSWEMMKGRKSDFFVLGLRFLPWALLCILTLGIGFLWLGPYAQITFANFYDDVKMQLGELEIHEDDITDHLVEG